MGYDIGGRVRVEVLGRYLNHADQGKRIQDVLELVPSGPPESDTRTTKQVHRRLRSDEVDQLVAEYRAGAKVKELATRYNIHKYTVGSILNRQQVVRRPQGIPPERIGEAAASYLAGSSLATIGGVMSVDAATVGRTLRKAGISLRPRPGWPQ